MKNLDKSRDSLRQKASQPHSVPPLNLVPTAVLRVAASCGRLSTCNHEDECPLFATGAGGASKHTQP